MEAVAISAHLFVHLGAIADAAHPTYPAILEEVPGLSRTYIQALLQGVLREATYRYTDRRGSEKETYTLVDFHGLKSEKVGGALKGESVVPSVTLVRPGSTGIESLRHLHAENLFALFLGTWPFRHLQFRFFPPISFH
jgi:hypothetical protein